VSGSLATEKPGMDKKLFKRLTKSMRQHAKIARGELPPSRVTSRESSDDIGPELRASIARGLADADAGRLVSRRGPDERVRDR
jgi:hypothetical protein